MNQTQLTLGWAIGAKLQPHSGFGGPVGHWLLFAVLSLSTLWASGPAWTQGMGGTPTPANGAAPPSDKAQVLSMNFQNIEMRAALQVIADFTGLNVVVSDSVTGHVTVRFKDVSWVVALDALLQAKGLAYQRQGEVLWVATQAEISAREKKNLEARQALQALEPLQTRAFELSYARASEVLAYLLGTQASAMVGAAPWNPYNPHSANPSGTLASLSGNPRILSPRGSVMAEPRTNQVFVTDVADRLEQVAQMLARIDVPLRQILIEARIVEATDTFSKALGVRLGAIDAAGAAQGVGNNLGAVVNNARVPGVTAAATDVSGSMVNLPAAAINGAAAATVAVSIYDASKTRLLGLEISALESDGQGKVVSSPRVVTANQTKAVIEQGTELPYQTATSSGATSIAFRKANLKLEVTPQIAPNGGIILDLDISKDSVGQSTTAGFAIDTKHVNTQVLVEDGGTVVIGGIYELNESNGRNKVPFFADIPGLGWLFQNSLRSSKKQELLVFISPKMVNSSAPAR
ncbi:MAG: type IV pilus secretin PilQ [Betaproteobacteria bacterium]|nr:type IV pilus secretin PilQ [Betaproteobacteria bacterium]